MTEQIKNSLDNPTSALASGISSGALSLTVAAGNGSRFPATGTFRVKLTDQFSESLYELVICTARAGDVLTITRAAEGTTARAFNVGDTVDLVLSAAALTAYVAENSGATALADHLADTTDAHDASAISFDPVLQYSLEATDVQNALAEVVLDVGFHPYSARSSNTVLSFPDRGKTIVATAAYTQTFDVTEILLPGWWCIIKNGASDASAILVLDPSGTETINGQLQLSLIPGASVLITCDDGIPGFVTVTFSGVVTPQDLFPDLIAWYDASDTASITASGGAVSQLNDKSGNGNHLTQSVAGSKPTTGTRTIAGLNTLDFDGGDSLNTVTADGQTPVQAYVVCEPDTVAAGSRTMLNWGGANAQWYIDANDPSIYFGVGVISAANQASAATPLLVAGYDRGTSDIVRANGTTATGNAGALTAATAGGLGGVGGVNFFDGKIAEVLVFNKALPTIYDLAVREYLAKKWGVTA